MLFPLLILTISHIAFSPKQSRMRESREDNPFRTQGIQSIFSTQISGKDSLKGYKTRHKRGKSETLRAQYINTKEVRSGYAAYAIVC